GKVRMDRFAALRSGTGSDDPVERLRQRATAMSEAGAALKKLADATDPLYKSLDENQKRRFAILNRVTGPNRGGFRGREGDGMRRSASRIASGFLAAAHKTPLIPAPTCARINSSGNPRLRVPGERSETRDLETRSAALIPATGARRRTGRESRGTPRKLRHVG